MIRNRLPERTTDPSMMASTCSVRAISGSGSRVALEMADVREMTRMPAIVEASNQCFCHSINEKFLSWIARQVL